jgi:uncharacterized lipoprotein YddW (UPF0748 family)
VTPPFHRAVCAPFKPPGQTLTPNVPSLHRRARIARLILAAAIATVPCTVTAQAAASSDTAPPPIAREFRGVWVATVGNIDWPSRPGLSTWEQQSELITLLNRAVEMHLNAVVFQIRPQTDALYDSRLEPWSPFITGEMGRPPEPYYDPLAFAVREAHARGLELHAWFNPYRALYAGPLRDVAPSHVSQKEPGIVRSYGKYEWLDPGDPAVLRHSIAVITDVVRRYDVDGVHIDDYFYPYPESDSAHHEIDFPDSASWTRYVQRGGTLSRADWRRQNVNRFVERMYRAVHAVKPWVKVGVSPFGLWQPGSPTGSCCFDAYAKLYADSRLWLQKGWMDYVAPQLYWSMTRKGLEFPAMLTWWAQADTLGRHLWPGVNVSLARDTAPRGRGAAELLDEIALARQTSGVGGVVLWNMKALLQDPDSVTDKLVQGLYAGPALVPATPWLDHSTPATPHAHIRRGTMSGDLFVDLRSGSTKHPWLWVVQARSDSGWTTVVLPGSEKTHLLAGRHDPLPLDVRVRAVGRTGNLSREVRVKIPGSV